MNDVVPIRRDEEEPEQSTGALVTILQSEPEIAAWLAGEEAAWLAGDEDDEPPRAA